MTNNELKLVIPADCSNSPKKNTLKEFNVALVKQDMSYVAEQLADDVRWNIVGDQSVEGKDAFIDTVMSKVSVQVTKFELSHIITHGNVASANGYIDLKDGNRIAFCHVYKFGSFKKEAKIKECTSYFIEIS